jgi:hypothetical protein
MTEFQHTILGSLIMIFLWVVWLHPYFNTQKNRDDIADEIDYWFNR